MFNLIFDYKYGNFLCILTIFLPMKTGINTLPNKYVLFTSTNYVSALPGKTKNNIKNGRMLTAVRSVEPIVPNFCRKSFSVRFFPIC